MIRNISKGYSKILLLICLFVFVGQKQVKGQHPSLDSYNIVWTEQSNDASESMPLVGGDIGCNVWVENGDILMYVQRSGSLSENGEYLKMGRIRLLINPNPFTPGAFFRQELKLSDGFIEIESNSNDGEKGLNTRIKLWVEIDRPIVHIDVDANSEIEVEAVYESWRTENKELLDVPDGSRERFTCFSLEGYPGKVIRVKDEIRFSDGGILFYHRNPSDKLVPEIFIKQQRLEASADEIFDDKKIEYLAVYYSVKDLFRQETVKAYIRLLLINRGK